MMNDDQFLVVRLYMKEMEDGNVSNYLRIWLQLSKFYGLNNFCICIFLDN